MNHVFLLWHTHLKSNDEEDDKLIGVYESQEAAQSAMDRVGSQPGFIDHPSGFRIEPHKIGVDGWTEGFVEVISKQE